MSLDSFKTEIKPKKESTNMSVDDLDWHISSDGYWDEHDSRFFGEDKPNDPPLMNVPEKLAADMDYIEDPQTVLDIAESLEMRSPDRYDAAIRVIFNDFSTWHWPILKGDRELTNEVMHFIDEYMPQIVQWRAIVAGEDPKQALDEWNDVVEEKDYSWMDEIDNTELSEDDRQYLNDNASWLEHISRKVDAPDIDIEDDSDWADDW